jgi:hypothetical protein
MFQIERVKGLSKTDGNGRDKAIQNTNSIAQMELFESLPNSFRIARFKVQDGVLSPTLPPDLIQKQDAALAARLHVPRNSTSWDCPNNYLILSRGLVYMVLRQAPVLNYVSRSRLADR